MKKINEVQIRAAFEDISEAQAGSRADSEASYIGMLLDYYQEKLGQKFVKVLDVPCGLGRHDRRLRRLGFSVQGIDIDPDFIKIAKSRYPQFKKDYRVGDMKGLPYKSGSFDAVLCLYSSFNIPDDNNNVKVLREFARVLREGGLLIVDSQNKGPIKAVNGRRFITNVDGGVTRVVKVKFAGNYRVDDELLFVRHGKGRKKIAQIVNRERLYTPKELSALLERNDLNVLGVYKAYSMAQLGRNDPYMTLVARRR